MIPKRPIVVPLLAAMLAIFTSAPSSARTGILDRAGKDAANDLGDTVAIGLGVTTGVLVLIGGAVWYYLHHRQSGTTAAADPPAPEGEAASRSN